MQVDGGVNADTAPLCVDAGANVLTSGTFIFGDEIPAKETGGAVAAVDELRRILLSRWISANPI